MAMLHSGKAYSDDLLWRIVWNRNFRRMTVSDVASEMLVSESTVQRYVERFQQTGSVSPCVKKNGTDRMLSDLTRQFLCKRS